MNFLVTVLIATVTVNCLVTTINGKKATDALAVPYIDMLLPPLENVEDNDSKDAPTKINSTAKATSVYKTTTKTATTSTTTTRTTTTKKPITNDVNNILPELSIEALLPPLFEANIEKEETSTSTNTKTTTKTTTTRTTTKRPTTTTTMSTTTTEKPSYTTRTSTSKPNLKVPDLFLDPLLPPLLENNSVYAKDEKVITTTLKPITTTQKFHQQQSKHTEDNTDSSKLKNSNKLDTKDKYVAESQIKEKPVSLLSHQEANKLQYKAETVKQQYAAKQKLTNTNAKYNKQFNYNFNLYLGSTTPRPAKTGLPTITPFPHRLRR